jgi:hypothetical protein
MILMVGYRCWRSVKNARNVIADTGVCGVIDGNAYARNKLSDGETNSELL